MIEIPSPILWRIYCDESRQNQGCYKVMGSIWVRDDAAGEFLYKFGEMCKCVSCDAPKHMKWGKVPTKPECVPFQWYVILVDLYFLYNVQGRIWFKAIVAEDYRLDHPKHNQGDPEVGFHKLYYEMLLPCLEPTCIYDVRVAQRDVSQKAIRSSQVTRLAELHQALNLGMRKRWSIANDVVRTVEPRDAPDSRFIQLADILMGATGYHWYQQHQASNASRGKVTLAAHIASKAGRATLRSATSRVDRTFNVFHFNPDKYRGAHMST